MRRLQAPPPPAVAMILPAAAPSSTSAIEAPSVAPPLPELADKPEPLADAMVRQQEIEQLLNSWTTAWQQQDLDAYCAAYSAAFEPANGEDRGRWQRDRTRTIDKARNIRIQWHDLSWTSAADAAATAEIWLDYQAAGYGDSTRKQLLLRREDGSLRIVSEQNLEIERR